MNAKQLKQLVEDLSDDRLLPLSTAVKINSQIFYFGVARGVLQRGDEWDTHYPTRGEWLDRRPLKHGMVASVDTVPGLWRVAYQGTQAPPGLLVVRNRFAREWEARLFGSYEEAADALIALANAYEQMKSG